MLLVAVKVGAVNVSISWFTAMQAFSCNRIFFRIVYGDGNSFIKHVAFAFEQFAFYFGVF
jgi:hypothetical protein